MYNEHIMNFEQTLKNIPAQPKKIFFWVKLAILAIFLVAIVITATHFYIQNKSSQVKGTSTSQEMNEDKNIYLAFTDEIYDKIQEHYWNKISNEDLSNLYKLATEKINGKPVEVFFNDKPGVNAMVEKVMTDMTDEQKKEFVVNLNNTVLANLEPFGRGGLFSQQQEEELKNEVSNVDSSTDLYQVLDIDKDSSNQEIQENYEQKREELDQIVQDKTKTEEEIQTAQEKLALVDRAYETLGNQEERQLYNQSGIESTVDSRLVTPNIFYLHLKKMSPTSFEEFQRAANSVDDQPDSLNTLILDLRDNIGGSVDLMQWFLGPFIGQNNLAYEFYHQEEYEPFKTLAGWLPSLVRYKKVVILINGNVQSSAEVMAATLKKYNVGVLVGTRTKGWGTIEKIFPLDNQIDPKQKYSIFLVHSITLRDDNQPIEGRGVEPHINIENPDWKNQLLAYFNYPQLAEVIQDLWNK
jgi:hypothetical protein